MTIARYHIVRRGEGWTIDHDGTLEGNYMNKEAAFESAAAAASLSIKSGFGIEIRVEARAPGETLSGGPA
jgi:hypothetical protein